MWSVAVRRSRAHVTRQRSNCSRSGRRRRLKLKLAYKDKVLTTLANGSVGPMAGNLATLTSPIADPGVFMAFWLIVRAGGGWRRSLVCEPVVPWHKEVQIKSVTPAQAKFHHLSIHAGAKEKLSFHEVKPRKRPKVHLSKQDKHMTGFSGRRSRAVP